MTNSPDVTFWNSVENFQLIFSLIVARYAPCVFAAICLVSWRASCSVFSWIQLRSLQFHGNFKNQFSYWSLLRSQLKTPGSFICTQEATKVDIFTSNDQHRYFSSAKFANIFKNIWRKIAQMVNNDTFPSNIFPPILHSEAIVCSKLAADGLVKLFSSKHTVSFIFMCIY